MSFLAQVSYTGNGSTTQYSITFPYIDVTHVKAYLDGTLTTAYTISSSTLTFTTAPANGVVIRIERETPNNNRLVDFTDGSVLTESDLDRSADQNFYIAQEITDDSASKLGLDTDDKYDANNKVIKNVANPVNNTDAVNKQFISTNLPNITTVAGISADVTTVAGISGNVTTVAGNNANVSTVATNIASVNTVATNIADVITVANDLNEAISEIETTANDLNEAVSEIDTVANSINNVNLVGTDITNVNTVATNIANVNTVAGNNANVSTVAGISGNVTTVAGISADVTAVAGDATDIGTVATDIANVNTVAGSIANVNSVATNIANVNSVAGNSANINAVAGNATNINAVNANSANINTVAGANANVTTVAGSIANVNEVANNIGTVNNFADRYRVQAGEPSVNNDEGDLVYDTTANAVKVYNGTSFDTIQQGITDVAPTRHSIRPSLNLDFANSKALDPRITFTRASNATYYDGYTSVKAEENLLSYSRFNTQTNLDGGSRTSTTETAPDGTSTASEITYDGTTKTHYYKTNTLSATLPASTYTSSIFLKKGTQRYMQVFQQISQSIINVDLDTGTTSDVGVTPLLEHGAIDVGNGWYRVYMVSNATTQRNIWTLPITSMTSAYYESNSASGTTLFWGVQIEERDSLTAYTPTTSSPITKYQPALQTAQNNVARFDHNPTTGESLGLLIEESRTNLFTYSEDYTQSVWSKANSSITANTILAPDGTLSADKIVANATGTGGGVQRTYTTTANTNYTMSVYFKKGEYKYVRIHWGKSGSPFTRIRIIVNLDDGSFTNSDVGTPTSITTRSVTDVGNGWYRVSLGGTFDTTSTDGALITEILDDSQNLSFSGNGYSGVYIWGAQLEEGSFPTSYIKTTGSQVTRSADDTSMNSIDTSDWFKSGEGSIYTEFNTTRPPSTQYVWDFIDTSSSNGYLGLRLGSNGELSNPLSANNTLQAYGAYAGFITENVNENYKNAVSFKFNDYAMSAGGQTALTDSSCLVKNFTDLKIGSFDGSNNKYNGTIKKLAYYPTRLTNNELQDLSEE